MTTDFLKMHIARLLKESAVLAGHAQECRAKLAAGVSPLDAFDVEFYTARLAFYVAQSAQIAATADMYARILSEQEPAVEASSDEGVSVEGVVLVQPETIAATIEILEDALAATEADLWRDDERGGEGHHHAAHLAYFRLQVDLCCAFENGDAGTAQRIVAQFEEVNA